MSRHSNVNPAHYKVKGRERQGEDVIHEMHKQAFSRQTADEHWQAKQDQPAPPHPPEQAAAEQAAAEPPAAKPTRARKTSRRKIISKPTGRRKVSAKPKARKIGRKTTRPAERRVKRGKPL